MIATVLVETGSRMDDIIFEEFKGTGNAEIKLDRALSEARIFPAIDLAKSGTRHEELLLSPEECEGVAMVRRMLGQGHTREATGQLIGMLLKTEKNEDFFKSLQFGRKKGILYAVSAQAYEKVLFGASFIR